MKDICPSWLKDMRGDECSRQDAWILEGMSMTGSRDLGRDLERPAEGTTEMFSSAPGGSAFADQRAMWNRIYSKVSDAQGAGPVHLASRDASIFAKEVAPYLRAGSQILELGCGYGLDAMYFARCGHTVIATDFSEEAIGRARRFWGEHPLARRVDFRVMDMAQPFPHRDGSFDAVYSHLSLHYFTDEVTRKILAEIRRVLRPSGLLFVCCRSTSDPLYGRGRLIEKDMYELDGHVRRFFSEDYLVRILDGFDILKLCAGTADFYQRLGAFVKAVARKASP